MGKGGASTSASPAGEGTAVPGDEPAVPDDTTVERCADGWNSDRLPGAIGAPLGYDPAWCLAIDQHQAAAETDTGEPDAAEPGASGTSASGIERHRVEESLLCLADGVIGTRGVLEEACLSEVPGVGAETAIPTVVAAGLYEPAAGVGEQLAGLPPWCDLPLVDGLGPGRRMLDLRDGTLHRVVTAEHPTRHSRHRARGAGTADTPPGLRQADHEHGPVIRTLRFASASRPGTEVLLVECDAGALAAPVAGTGEPEVQRYRSAATGGAVLARSTSSTPIGIDGNGQVLIQRIGFYAVSSRRAPRDTAAVEGLATALDVGSAGLLAEQRARWARRWTDADIEVIGDVDTTRALRFALFNVLSSARSGPESAVGARGLTGPAYAGHVLWDTDVFVLPVLAAVDPARARSVLGYRLRRLEQARRRAAGEGRRGARFPWESAGSGDDVTPRSGIDDNGRIVPIRTGDLEVHITADVAWAAWRYAAWTGDWAFLDGPGQPLVVEPARYWAGRVRWDSERRAHIDRVIGPDEYHEDVDDNAFTNLMARWNLRRAAELVDRRSNGKGTPGSSTADGARTADVGESGHRIDTPGPEEAAHWRRIADALVDGYDPGTGCYEQFSGYRELTPLMVATLGTPPLPADLILGHRQVAATQIAKQADVLMAHHMIPGEVAPGSLVPNLDFYLPRTAHGSSLSPAVHSALLARAGRSDEALQMLSLASAVDLDDLTQTTAQGLHLANLGGLWQAVVLGFAGVQVQRPDDRTFQLAPRLPQAWRELRLTCLWHGRRIRLACRHDGVHVGCTTPVTVTIHGTTTHVEPPGRWIT